MLPGGLKPVMVICGGRCGFSSFDLKVLGLVQRVVHGHQVVPVIFRPLIGASRRLIPAVAAVRILHGTVYLACGADRHTFHFVCSGSADRHIRETVFSVQRDVWIFGILLGKHQLLRTLGKRCIRIFYSVGVLTAPIHFKLGFQHVETDLFIADFHGFSQHGFLHGAVIEPALNIGVGLKAQAFNLNSAPIGWVGSGSESHWCENLGRTLF